MTHTHKSKSEHLQELREQFPQADIKSCSPGAGRVIGFLQCDALRLRNGQLCIGPRSEEIGLTAVREAADTFQGFLANEVQE